MDKEDIIKLIKDDDLGLLNVKSKKPLIVSDDERLISSFEEINQFFSENDREPETENGHHELRLYNRLQGLREDQEKLQKLQAFDNYGLLKIEIRRINSITDVFKDDDLGILQSDADSIFELKHVPKTTTMPNYIASRKSCKNFDEFKDKFIQCQADLKLGKRKLWTFRKEQQIEEGLFFVLNGILLYIDNVGKRQFTNGKMNARLRCIFENGTEADLLLRSLAAGLYKDGKRVTEHEDYLLNDFDDITDKDEETGFIYILKSLSQKSKIQQIDNLYKIGFSRIPIEQRIKDAENEPTFLMAPVAIVTAFKCYNMNPQKLEQLLHKFFGSACLNLDVYDSKGKRHTPREWFIAPIDIVEQAINLIINGEIINHRYDTEKEIIIGITENLS